jgi:NhaP-type Na+/H+ or K+/H+ antiporter
VESLAALVVLLVAGYALIAARLNRWSVGPALYFVVVGMVTRVVWTGDVPAVELEAALAVVEVTLALILFTDASTIDFDGLRDEAGLVTRLLSVGLLLSILAGTALAALLFPQLPLGVALLLGAGLAPTDAALGQPVVSNPVVPVRIRRLLNAESGLNDGIATPFVVLAIAIIGSEGTGHGDWLATALREGIVGVASGVAIGAVGGLLLVLAERHRWTSRESRQLAVFALALSAYFVALAFGGNGFIAAFIGGLAFGTASRHTERGAADFAEETGSLLSIVVWTIAGGAFVEVITHGPAVQPVVYAVLSLTLIRMVPVAIALVRGRLRPETVLFIGWFGPRGLASIVFALLGIQAMLASNLAVDTVGATFGWTILLSVVLHGLSAGPIAAWYGRRIASLSPPLLEIEARPEPASKRRLEWVPPQTSTSG